MTNIDTDAPGFLGHPTNDSKRLQVIPTVTDADLKQMDALRRLFDSARDLRAQVMIHGPTTKFAAEMLELWAAENGIVLERERFDPATDAVDPRPYVTFRASGPGKYASDFVIAVLAAVYL